jgi:hypothetical protein
MRKPSTSHSWHALLGHAQSTTTLQDQLVLASLPPSLLHTIQPRAESLQVQDMYSVCLAYIALLCHVHAEDNASCYGLGIE